MQTLAGALEVPADPGDGLGGVRRLRVPCTCRCSDMSLEKERKLLHKETKSQASSRPELTRLLS